MMSNYQTNLIKGQPAPNSETILQTINEHFYFFGRVTDEIIIPFGYNGDDLILNGRIYEICSHFKLFFKNLFFCLAMWLGVEFDRVADTNVNDVDYYKRDSVASIVSKYVHKLSNSRTNEFAMMNDFSSQECVIHWGLCNSTSKGFSSLNMLCTINDFALNPNDKVRGLEHEINLSSCKNIEEFLSHIKIPQLLPSEIVTEEIREKLKGLCTIGKCNRLPDQEGIDVGFDLFFKGIPCKGFIECKYINVDIGKSTVLEYVSKAKDRNSPFSMLFTYSMQKCLKSADSWKSKPEKIDLLKISTKSLNEVEENEKLVKKRKKMEEITEKEKLIEGISIYSVFYEGYAMVAVPLVEYENPTSVFVIIQTNFIAPKI